MENIQQNVPLPQTDTAIFEAVNVGDSFQCDERMYKHARQWFYKKGKKIITRKIEDNCFRIWRIE
jgi:hypothetical protein